MIYYQPQNNIVSKDSNNFSDFCYSDMLKIGALVYMYHKDSCT